MGEHVRVMVEQAEGGDALAALALAVDRLNAWRRDGVAFGDGSAMHVACHEQED